MSNELEDLSGIPGDGALYSTVDDLRRWDASLANGALMAKTSLELMTTPHLSDYGLGVSLETIAGRRAQTHTGGVRGFRSFFTRFPDERAVMILLSNQENTPMVKLRDHLASVLFCDCR